MRSSGMTTSARQRVLHVGVVEVAAAVAHGGDHGAEAFGATARRGASDISPAIGSAIIGDFARRPSRRDAAADSASRLAARAIRSRSVPTTMMWWLSWATVEAIGHAAPVAEARDEAVDHPARCRGGVRPARSGRRPAPRRFDEAVAHGKVRVERARSAPGSRRRR